MTVSVTYLVCLGLGLLGGLSLGDPAVGGPLQLGGINTSRWLDNTTFQLSVDTTIQLSSDHTRPSAVTAFHPDSTLQLPDDCFPVILISPSHGVAFLSCDTMPKDFLRRYNKKTFSSAHRELTDKTNHPTGHQQQVWPDDGPRTKEGRKHYPWNSEKMRQQNCTFWVRDQPFVDQNFRPFPRFNSFCLIFDRVNAHYNGSIPHMTADWSDGCIYAMFNTLSRDQGGTNLIYLGQTM